ncbi:MAG: M24 family metallopeptidase [Acidimicrobiales bacterium]
MLIDGVPVPDAPDLTRMRRERHARLQAELEAQGLDGLLLLGTNAVAYATGAEVPAADSGRACILRPVAAVVRGAEHPHLFTPYPEGVAQDLPEAYRHDPVFPEADEGVPALAAVLEELFPGGSRLAVDELTHAMARGISGISFVSASSVLGPARLVKTVDEIACIRAAQRINELAMSEVYSRLCPGVRQTELTARFLRAIFELGATANGIDPIWQVMSPTLAEGPWTTHGHVAFPTPSTDRILRSGDMVWVDSGIDLHGYASDFGRTWLVDIEAAPTGRQQAQFERWRSVMTAVLKRLKPGATALELGQAAVAANEGTKPWLEHFYLAHGIGTESAEMPLIGTDLGEAFDHSLVLQPGMVLVLEPVIWDDGAGGYRSEEVFAVTDDGWMSLSDHPYDPFEGDMPW